MNRLWLIVQPSGKTAVLCEGTEEPTLAQMQQAVGGLIEYAPVAQGMTLPMPASLTSGAIVEGDVLDVIVNEEGLLQGMEANPIASLAAQGPDGLLNMLVGPAIVVFRIPDEDEAPKMIDRDTFLLRNAPEDAEHLMNIDGMMPSLALEPHRRD